MICQGIDCQGFDDAVPLPGGGFRLQRVHESLRPALNPGAAQKVLTPASNELRGVTDDGVLTLTLSSSEAGLCAVPFFGGFQHGQLFSIGTTPTRLQVGPPNERLGRLGAAQARAMPYSPRVVRLLLHGGGELVLHGAEGKGLRLPTADEVPKTRLLTYGTSITHGAAATRPHLPFVRQLAWRLGADLINLGVGGACHCEPALADYIAGRTDWTLALLSLSVNMIGAGFTPESFYERVHYMVDKVAGANTARPVACVTIYPHFRDFPPGFRNPNDKAPPEAFREALRRAVADCPHPNVHLIEGPEILDDITGLSTDLLHPGDLGMIRMGENLASRLRAWT